METVLNVYKPIGKTPLEMIRLLQNAYPKYKQVKISYAGRLDPMAEGVLLLLIDEENKKRQSYESLQKTYEFDLLLGITTDTYDLLGNVLTSIYPTKLQQEKLYQALPTLLGKQEQSFPPYSSKPVGGKPLFWWAREDKLSEIEIPHKTIELFSLELLKQKPIQLTALLAPFFSILPTITGDFRQENIKKRWEKTMREYMRPFPLFTCRVTCTSGTYVRSLCEVIGEKIGCGALASRICRTNVGTYAVNEALRLMA